MNLSICQRIFDSMGQDKARLRALAQSLGVASSTVSTWKARHTDPPARYIMPIADFLGVSPLWLLTGTPEGAPARAEAPSDAPLYEELRTVYDSLDRPGQIIMLAAGYREQLRLQGSLPQRTAVPPPPKICSKN